MLNKQLKSKDTPDLGFDSLSYQDYKFSKEYHTFLLTIIQMILLHSKFGDLFMSKFLFLSHHF